LSTPYYPIRGLEDILAKFREELNNALAPIYERLDRLEDAVFKEGVPVERVTPEVAPTEGGEETERLDSDSLRDYIIQVRYLNIALRGYGQLLKELGLPKDMRQALTKIEDMVMVILRAIQLIRILTWMMEGVYIAGPMGWLVAGGFFSGMIAYGGKTLGGF
jgi:hypothetical protein